MVESVFADDWDHESGKVGLFAGGAPGAPDEQVTVERVVRIEDVDYFDGE